jgi:proteasome lid subunit RPN8/RPN11
MATDPMPPKVPDRTGEQRVRIAPPVTEVPRRSYIPHALRRWLSPHDGPDSHWAVRVYVSQSAIAQINEHAASDMDNEVGGALLGRWRKDARDGSQFVVVEAMLPARHTRHGSAFLTFTQESLLGFHEEQASRFPRKQIVGWFHTHPRMGVFLSEYDLWLAEHFFPASWQVSLVVEPHSSTGGFFVRDENGQLPGYRYSGLYEMLDPDGRGRLRWKNLTAERMEIEFTGG